MRFAIFFAAVALAAAQPAARTVTLLATTDLHGHIFPVDYHSGKPAARGLAKIATLIGEVRRETPGSLLIDCGDTIQGSALEFVYQTMVRTGRPPLDLKPSRPLEHDPMMLVMNRLGYAAMTVGNHEYNFGLKAFNRARADARFPWLSANTEVAPGATEKPFEGYILRTVNGVRVAVIGITTPAVPSWEKPENLGGYRFLEPVEAARRAVARVRRQERAEIVVAAVHAGLGRNLKTGAPEEPAENVAWEVARQVPGIDVLVFGHSHRQLTGERVGRTLLVQPRNWGISLARVDITVTPQDGRWVVGDSRSRLLPVLDSTPADPEILELARPYHELAERYLASPVATASRALEGTYSRVEDTPLLDAVQTVELHYSGADVSLASMFNTRVRVPQGPMTVRELAALYPYDNELYVVEATGKMLKDALENAARFFLSCQGEACSRPPLINREVAGYNYDVAQGVEYEIDLTRPAGDRIRNLRWRGRPLDPGQKLRLAVNNYRAAGSGGYDMFRGARILWRSGDEIRDLLVRYYTERGELPATSDGNWRIIPEAALQTLRRQAAAEAGQADSQR